MTDLFQLLQTPLVNLKVWEFLILDFVTVLMALVFIDLHKIIPLVWRS